MEKEIVVNGVTYVQKESQTEGLKYQIVRSRDAGVFAGYVESRNGTEVVMLRARRLWYWNGAASLSQLAVDGVSKPDDCKFPAEVSRVEVLGVCEILDVTDKAKKCIEQVIVWEK